ncbi:MAG: TonB-dependent receptor [Saprospiraceae bacterium]|nr:TonB-dependent receptor [Saprospiraceae bacterium]
MKISSKYLLFSLALLSLSHLSQAQTLRGTVRDAATGTVLAGANLLLSAERDTARRFVTTDTTGEYIFQNLHPGYYRINVTYGGYRPMILREINIAGGKETLLDIAYDQNIDLPLLTVVNASSRRQPQPLSEIPLTREQTLRFPATFFDPARLAMAYPGVMNNDDQANGLSIRGNSPAFVRWRLEGVDIVNPNHLPNAGTLSDRPVAAGGGVLMFSAQMLDNSSLLTGNFPAGYGDALSGMMDMHLRRGNNRQHEFTAQAGLIGLDLAAEGPLWRSRGISYSVNYRYSTVGLLGEMGINFGDEKINFQDLSFHVSVPTRRGGELAAFALFGSSKNIFTHKSDSAAIKAYKDLFDIDFTSDTRITGLTWRQNIGEKTHLSAAAAWSEQTNERSSQPFLPESGQRQKDRSNEDVQSYSLTITHLIRKRFRLEGGANYVFRDYKYHIERNTDAIDQLYQTESIQPWTNLKWTSRNEKTTLSGGLHGMWWLQNGFTPEPRFFVTQRLGERHAITGSWGRFSQIPAWWQGERLLTADHTGLRYTWRPSQAWTWRGELFFQNIGHAPAISYPDGLVSALNESEAPVPYVFDNQSTSKGRNYGLELSAERLLAQGWFLLANTTLFKAETQNENGPWQPSRWAVNNVVNLTAGKEWQRSGSGSKTKFFGISGRAVWAGGFRAMPLDENASAFEQTTVYSAADGFSIRQPDFFRLDLRIYWKRSLGDRRNSTFAMDFQNATMQENTAYRYYDPFTKQVETKNQLGLIPNISWRLEF